MLVRTGKVDNPINELMIYPSKEKYMLSRKEPFIAYFDRLKSYMTSLIGTHEQKKGGSC